MRWPERVAGVAIAVVQRQSRQRVQLHRSLLAGSSLTFRRVKLPAYFPRAAAAALPRDFRTDWLCWCFVAVPGAGFH